MFLEVPPCFQAVLPGIEPDIGSGSRSQGTGVVFDDAEDADGAALVRIGGSPEDGQIEKQFHGATQAASAMR